MSAMAFTVRPVRPRVALVVGVVVRVSGIPRRLSCRKSRRRGASPMPVGHRFSAEPSFTGLQVFRIPGNSRRTFSRQPSSANDCQPEGQSKTNHLNLFRTIRERSSSLHFPNEWHSNRWKEWPVSGPALLLFDQKLSAVKKTQHSTLRRSPNAGSCFLLSCHLSSVISCEPQARMRVFLSCLPVDIPPRRVSAGDLCRLAPVALLFRLPTDSCTLWSSHFTN
jgi:hypothetical protein